MQEGAVAEQVAAISEDFYDELDDQILYDDSPEGVTAARAYVKTQRSTHAARQKVHEILKVESFDAHGGWKMKPHAVETTQDKHECVDTLKDVAKVTK